MDNSRTDIETGDITSDVDGDGSSTSSSELVPLLEWMTVLNRVPPQLREKKKHVYDPSVVSLGPFHHGRPHLPQLEEFKEKLVNIIFKEEDRRLLFHSKILERIDDVRHFYEDLSREELDDEALALMMLRDACCLLYALEFATEKEGLEEEEAEKEEEEERLEKYLLLVRYLGMFQATLMESDCLKLENQIPWWVLTSLVNDYRRSDLIRRYLSYRTYGNFTQLKHLLWEENANEDDQPQNLLEALRLTIIINPTLQTMEGGRVEEMVMSFLGARDDEAESSTSNEAAENTTDHLRSPPPCPAVYSCWAWWRKRKSSPYTILHPSRRPFRTVTELRAKGIHFRPSDSTFLLDIHFTSFYFFAVLRLPVMVVQKQTEIVFSNMVALEMCPGSRCFDSMVTSYLTLMKSMIERAEDVKELQEKGIVVSFVEDNEKIVRMLKEMDSSGVDLVPIFDEIKMRINHHCNSKARTWIADLINTNFRSPWTAIALATAAFLLCLTFLQTYFTINPRT